jgi:hypothetical protein
LIASPYAFNYDMTALSAMLICVLAYRSHDALRPGELLAFIATWSLPMLMQPMNEAGAPLGPVIIVIMLGYLVLRAKSENNAQTLSPKMARA